MERQEECENEATLLARAVTALRTTVLALERYAADAARSAEKARELLTMLELECDDSGIIKADATAYLEPILSQNPNQPHSGVIPVRNKSPH